MARKLTNANEKLTLQELKYVEKPCKRGKLEKQIVGPEIF